LRMCVWPYDLLCLTIFVRNCFRRDRRGCRFSRLDFAFFGPDSRCRIELLPLDFRHLAERMFFARYAKQQYAERNSTEAVAEEKSHNALAQLSASLLTCKLKARASSAFRLRSTTAVSAAFVSNAGHAAMSASTKD
jgi:hypothetical protein